MQLQQCRKREMMSSIRLNPYDVTSCKQSHLIVKHPWCKGVLTCYNHRKFGKFSFINFQKKVYVSLDTLYNRTDRQNRLCKLCIMNMVENEYHFVLVCPVYNDLRRQYLPSLYCRWPSQNEYINLFKDCQSQYYTAHI